MIARYLKYGNDCLLYQTIVLEDNIIITINREKGGWCDKAPQCQPKYMTLVLKQKQLLNNCATSLHKNIPKFRR